MQTRIFCDGACKGNPGPGGWGVLVCTADEYVQELGGGEAHTTNNRMEITACLEALRSLQGQSAPIVLYTDSRYLIDGITSWINGWKRKGWKTSQGGDVLNQDLWKALDTMVEAFSIQWKYVKAHAGIPGNERVDEIAQSFAKNSRPKLFSGQLKDYPVDLDDLLQKR